MRAIRGRWGASLLALVMVTAGCAADGAGQSKSQTPDDPPIVIGFLGELTGNFAIWGVPARNGMRMAVEDVNADGGIDGRLLELVERDTRGVPEEAVTAFRGMVDRDGIVAVGGIVSSDVGLSAARAAEADEVPLLLVKAGSERILQADSRYTFRTCLPAAPTNIAPLAEFIVEQGFSRVGAIVADYAWGQSIRAAIEEQIGGLDVELQIEVAPVPETDFTSYLRRLEPLDAQIIIATGHPPGSGAITRQAAELGFEGLVTGPYAASAVVMEEVGDVAFDRYVDLACADVDSAGYRELAARYHEQFDDFMENDAVAGYGQVLMIAEAIRETGSDEPTAIAEYLHATTFELPGYAFPVAWTDWGELETARPLVTIMREQPPPEGVNPGAEWYPQILLRSEVIAPFRP